MTIDQARSLKKGDIIHHLSLKNADGSPMRAKVTSVIQFKRQPGRIDVHVKHGMYDFAIFDETTIDSIQPGDGRPSRHGGDE